MGFLNGSRSSFPDKIDEIKELYDLSPSLKKDAIRYQELISKEQLNQTEQEELSNLTLKLKDYIISAEDRNKMGDVIIKLQTFFKENVQDFVVDNKNKLTTFIQEEKEKISKYADIKTNEIKSFITTKQNEINQFINENKESLTNFIQQQTQSITELFNTKSEEIKQATLIAIQTSNNNKQEIIEFVKEKKQEAQTLLDENKNNINNEIAKFKFLGEWNNGVEYKERNMVRYKEQIYIAKQNNTNAIPIKEDNANWLLLSIKGDTGYSVNLTPKGVFNTSKIYTENNLVFFEGNLYRCIKKTIIGKYPTDTEYWELFLMGNGEVLNDLRTDDKTSLVNAINELKSKDEQLFNKINKKVDMVDNKGLSTNDYTTIEKNKLANIQENANNYVHPEKHSADMIIENTNKKFVTNAEKEKWNTVEQKANTNHTHNSSNISDLSQFLLKSTVGNSNKLDNLTSLNFVKNINFETTTNGISKEIFNNSAYNQTYIGVINYGTEVGFSGNHVKIIYIPHYNDGYGTQIAIPYEGGNYHGVFYRNSIGNKWGDFIELLDTRDRNPNNAGTTTNDANNCLDTGKAYYCLYTQTKNLPFGDNTDNGIIIPYMYSKEQFGFQIYMSWNGTAIYWRRKHFGNWSRWYCIGGGSWNQEIIKDSEQVGKYLRWNKYGQNHVIFDASSGIRPDGQACNNSEPDNLWTPTYPYLMGFNGHSTYGIKVNGANWADSANSVQGFPFRNNNGKLEVLVGGEWLSVGAKQYTVTRTGYIKPDSKDRFDYSGSSGVLRKIEYTKSNSSYTNRGPDIFLDGVKIDDQQYNNCELEFKNSISIVCASWQNYGNMGCNFVIQTEK